MNRGVADLSAEAAGRTLAASPVRSETRTPDTATAVIEQLDYDGRGVARVDDKVVFIDGALPGERVRFRYGRRRRRYDTGVALEVITPAPERVAQPPCPHFGTCGGCSLQHLQAPAQVAAKEAVLRAQLRHIGKVAPVEWLAPLTGPAWSYRRRARLGVRLVPKKGGVLVGFRERRHSYITPLTECKTLDVRFARLLPALPTLIAGLSCPERIPQIELAAGDSEAALIFRHLAPLNRDDRERLAEFGARHHMQIHLQPGGPGTVQPLWPVSPPLLSYRLPEHAVEIRFAPTDFTQVNADLNPHLVSQALKLLALEPKDRLADLYCGVGNFTLPAARCVALALGVEGDAGLVRRAAANAEHNGLTGKTRFQQADFEEAGATIPGLDAGLDKLLLDPPRSGAMGALKHLASCAPARIVYVSCYPATLARDAEYLVRVLGYRLQAAGVIDMFPQTSHVESMALFLREATPAT